VKRNRWNPRKVLVASAGVATVNYALATGCESSMEKMSVVANLMPAPGGYGGFPSVANLVAPPPEPPIELPPVGDAGSLDAGRGGPSDASLPDATDGSRADAAPAGTASDAGSTTPDGGP
jgi:hypothetical protein